MPADELSSTSDHLAVCPECFERFYEPKLGDAAYKFAFKMLETTSDDHLLYEQLAGYCDDRLSAAERQAVEHHLAACEECDEDLQGFFEVSELIKKQDEGRPYSAGPTADALPPFWERVRAYWRTPAYDTMLSALNYRSLLQAAIVLVIMAVVIWGMTRSSQRQIDGLKSEIGELEAENGALRDAASNANAQLAEMVKQNQEIRPSPDQSQIAQRLNDGIGQVILDQRGVVQGLEALPAGLRAVVQTALTSEQLQVTPSPVVKIGQVGTLLGEGDKETFKLITPVSAVAMSNNPTFKWEALPGATSYTVLCRDVNTGQEIESQSISDTQWTPKQPLVRGHTYAWMAEAIKDGRRLRSPALNQPYAAFKVLDQKEFDNIQRTQASWGGSHLVMGIMYARAGVKEAARKELKELQAANPDAHIIKNLIKSLDSKK